MPAIGGFFGWNEPPPAAMITTLASNVFSASVWTRNSGCSAVPIASRPATISPKWNVGPNGLIWVGRVLTIPLAGDDRKAGNVVDRLFRIKLGALAADLWQNVDKMGL